MEAKPAIASCYTTNRIGNRIGLFNIQYIGSLSKFEQSLATNGWKKQPDSLFYSVLMRASGQNSAQELPLMAQLYLNRKPTLIMTYPSGEGQSLYIVRLWRSNYHLRNYHQPIWLGSIIYLQTQSQTPGVEPQLFTRLLQALSNFKLNSIALPEDNYQGSLPNTTRPKLLIIEEPTLRQE